MSELLTASSSSTIDIREAADMRWHSFVSSFPGNTSSGDVYAFAEVSAVALAAGAPKEGAFVRPRNFRFLGLATLITSSLSGCEEHFHLQVGG